jgi:hypothetical protein
MTLKPNSLELGMAVHTWNPSTWETEAGGHQYSWRVAIIRSSHKLVTSQMSISRWVDKQNVRYGHGYSVLKKIKIMIHTTI